MDKYENLGLVGEGSYGMVLRCRHKESGQLVAIKKFLESDDDKTVRKIALREIKLLKQLRHDNLVNLIDAFRRKKRVYLVFEFVHHTVLDELEQNPRGLDAEKVRQILWQLCRAIDFCHQHNVIHRDIKPENILISKTGIVKLCDFGFARTCAQQGEPYTDYVATRWYRAPELLVGDTKYGKPIDIWAIGCLVPELATGEPLFPGDSDIDQIYHIVRAFGNLSLRLQDIFRRNKLYAGTKLPVVKVTEPLEARFPQFSAHSLDFLKGCLRLNAEERYTTAQLLKHDYFHHDGFAHKFSQELKVKIDRDIATNPLLREQKRHLMVTSAESGISDSTIGKTTDDQSETASRVAHYAAPSHPNLVPINEIAPPSSSTQLSISPAAMNSHHLPNVVPIHQSQQQQQQQQQQPPSQQTHHQQLQHQQQQLQASPVQILTPPPGVNNNNNHNNAANTNKYSDKILMIGNSSSLGSNNGSNLSSVGATNNSKGSNNAAKHAYANKPLKMALNNSSSNSSSTNNSSPPSVFGMTPPGGVTGYGYGGAGSQGANTGYRHLGRTKEQQPGMLDALPQLPDVIGTGSTMSTRDPQQGGAGRGVAGARRLGGQSQNAAVDIYANSSHHAGGKETLPNI